MIVYYTCDNCHTTFESVETVIPSTCPNCFREKRPHKVGAKIIVVPCVRNATETEIEWFENVQKQIADEEAIRTANQVFAEKIRMLGEPKLKKPYDSDDSDDCDEETERTEEDEIGMEDQEPYGYPADPYNLSIHEHNFALMLLYYIRELRSYGFRDLEKMIMTTDIDEKMELYQNVKKVFNRGINTEERGNEKPFRITREVWENATPALKTLYSFRQDNAFKALLCDTPNRGNVKRIDVRQLAENPSKGFTQFMTELYNGGEW